MLPHVAGRQCFYNPDQGMVMGPPIPKPQEALAFPVQPVPQHASASLPLSSYTWLPDRLKPSNELAIQPFSPQAHTPETHDLCIQNPG